MIGLIFGETNFPKEILKKVKKKTNYTIIDLTKKKIFKKERNSHSVSVGQFGKILSILKVNNCKKVLFAGKIKKPVFSKLKLDLKGIYYISRIIKKSKIGDAAILKEVINIFKKEKIKTIDSLYYTPELTLKTGIYTKTKPSKEDQRDINIAIKLLNKTNNYNFIQGAIVRNKKLLALEDKGGTKKMIKKCVKKIVNEGVLVKFPKKKQDTRIDLPTIGLDTLKQCKRAGLNGIVLKNKKNVFLDQRQSLIYANNNKMFIKVK